MVHRERIIEVIVEKDIREHPLYKIAVRYLKENHVYEQFCKNVLEYGKYRTVIDFFNSIILNTCPLGSTCLPGMIMNSFSWDKTKEGADFWYDLHLDFQRLCHKHYDKFKEIYDIYKNKGYTIKGKKYYEESF